MRMSIPVEAVAAAGLSLIPLGAAVAFAEYLDRETEDDPVEA